MKESRGITPLRTILQNCLNHIENLETNRSITDNYDKEFQDLKQFSETLKTQKEYSCTEGEKEVNRKKNRYKDILPFNISRVVLSEYAGIPGSDYINANYIKGASGSPAYIASQGPLPNTVNDFWRMVVECEVQVIVMACNAQESGKHKCENYWVEKEGEEKRFGMVQICLVKASTVCPDFLVRTMRLKYTNDKDVTEERTVCQFHYSAWPDHGVPPLVRPLLDMVRLVRDTQASETLPVLVHCSAGCGRTGTICAIDFVWGLLRAGKLTDEFSLFNLVKDMRKQRVAMVQTKEQYILVHQAVRELFKEQLRVIESHPYENIDFNGVPLIKDLEEPFYDTISTEKEENCDEKQDKSEMKNKGEDMESRINKGDAAPPLPRKKRPNVLFSKQEKEAENLTEKNRSSVTDATLSGLLGKPRIVKLRALFEKSANGKERTLKERGSQAVSRSHSLGAIRKPLSGEVFESPPGEKPKPSPPPTQPPLEPGKLKHSKSFSRSVPLIKRSRSLKTFGQSPHLCLSPPENPVILKNFHQKTHDGEGSLDNSSRKPGAGSLTKECSKRRRSLESLMGDVPPSAGWGGSVEPPGTELRSRQKSLDWSPKASAGGSSSKTTDILKQQLQKLSLETERKINTFVTGIGIRERRNSFRQAVTKSEFQTKRLIDSAGSYRDVQVKSGPSFDQPDGGVYEQPKTKSPFDGRKYKVREKHSDGVKKVVARHQTSSGGPATVKVLPSKEPESRNLFLKKLNSEMYEIQRDRSSQEESEKSSRCNPGLIRSDSKRTLFRMSISVKPSGSYAIHSDTEVDGRGGEENERLFLQPSRPDIHRGKKPSSSECYKCYGAPAPAAATATAGGTYARPSPPHKTLPLQGSSGEGSPSNRKPTPAKVHEIEVTFTSYRKALAPGSDVYGIADGSERKVSMPAQKRGAGKIKGYDHVTWGHPGPSRSSGDVSSSEHSSDSSKMGQYDAGENGVNLDVKVMKKPEQVRTRLGDPGSSKVIVNSEQSALQKRGDEGKMIPSMEFCNYGAGVVGTSKSRGNSSEYSKDDFLLKEPTAPPRVKRHASVTGPRSAVNGSDHVTRWISTENKMAAGRNAGFQQDKNAWNGTIGVDLDAVAASMQQDKREISTVLKDGVWSGKNATTPVKKKQHYL